MFDDTLRRCLLLSLALSLPVAAANGDEAEWKGWPFLQKYCVSCHGETDAEAELNLSPFERSVAVERGRKSFDAVLRMIQNGDMPPKDERQPTAAEVAKFTKHVRRYFDYVDRNAKPNPGRVTMRRLNRTEYRNTIRDLIGVQFDPTSDFPSDDIGHGFDNIGDVLTLPPVLMERYMAAAEGIVGRAILPNPPPPPKRLLSTRYSEPASADVGKRVIEGKYRRLATDGKDHLETGPINTPYKWSETGEYIFRTRVYAKSDRPVKVAVFVSGKRLASPSSEGELSKLSGTIRGPAKILKTFAVTADEPTKPQTLEVRVPAMVGRHRMHVANMKPNEGQSPVKLYVEYLALEGPLDTRPAAQQKLLAASPNQSTSENTREVLERFVRRAYRRSPTIAEVDRLVALAESVQADGGNWESAMQFAIQAVLCSPKFLFRVELDDRPTSEEMRPLDEFHLASRLSYFLWSSMPDEELLLLAETKQLTKQLDAQVRRMLADPKADEFARNFGNQWLQIQRLEWVAPDGQLFPYFNDELRLAMMGETEMFFRSVMREDRSILQFIDADYTFLNEPLARMYGIADTNGNWVLQKPEQPKGDKIRGDEFRRVKLQGRSRGGLLSQASVLTVTSNPTRTSPVKRGRWVLEQILGEPPPPPPPDVPELSEDKQEVAGATLRERMEVHRQNPRCANCHAKMDAIGFALENYNAVGAFRKTDGKFPVDASGEFPDGTKFDGPAELKSIIMTKKDAFARCLTEKMLIYALGRGLEYYDRRAVDKIVQEITDNNYRFSSLIIAIARSEPFRYRRGSLDQP